jgi:predicted nuclease of predicted toxin-antitoxin system
VTLRWLCNENIPCSLVEALRAGGHDVVWIREASPGITDIEVLARAAREHRLCLTFDKDFGELAAATALPAECGVLLLRVQPRASVASSGEIVAVLEARTDWAGHFSVLEPGRVRMRPLPHLR